MGFMSKIIGGRGTRSLDEYVEIDADDATRPSAARLSVRLAEIDERRDIVDIKDAVYDGHLVIADITRLRTGDQTIEHILDELRQVVREQDGDIVMNGDDQIIVTPTGVSISREKLGR